jgi:hypothetical protein
VIEEYLAELARLLPRGRRRRRILAEVEAHLRDAAAEHGDAEAIARFGAAAEVARAFPRSTTPLRVLAGLMFLYLAWTTAVTVAFATSVTPVGDAANAIGLVVFGTVALRRARPPRTLLAACTLFALLPLAGLVYVLSANVVYGPIAKATMGAEVAWALATLAAIVRLRGQRLHRAARE